MDIPEVIVERRSIRAFKPDPIPRDVLNKIAAMALRAPSWANTQPWELVIVSGAKLEAIKEAFVTQRGVKAHPDFRGPKLFTGIYRARFQALATRITEATRLTRAPGAPKASGKTRAPGRGQADRESPEWFLQGPRLYGAPAAIYILIDRSFYEQAGHFNVWPVFDCGLVAQNIMLLATHHGLGTIIQAQAAHYPDVLRQMLGIADSKLVLVGIAIGYPDWDNPINKVRSEREAVESVVKWYGFD